MTFHEENATLGAVALVSLAWLLANPAVTSVSLGASKLSQLEDNLGAVNVQLGIDDLRELAEATALPRLYPNWFHDWAADQSALAALGKN